MSFHVQWFLFTAYSQFQLFSIAIFVGDLLESSLCLQHHHYFLVHWLWNNVSFSFVSGVSGTSLFNSVSLMAYNVFYTSVPVLVSVLDKDLNEDTVMQHPQILFYCQAGRFVFKLHCPCFVCSLYVQNLFTWNCSGPSAVPANYYFSLVNVSELYVLETGFWTLVHLLDGLGDPFSMWVFVNIVSFFLQLLSLSWF